MASEGQTPDIPSASSAQMNSFKVLNERRESMIKAILETLPFRSFFNSFRRIGLRVEELVRVACAVVWGGCGTDLAPKQASV